MESDADLVLPVTPNKVTGPNAGGPRQFTIWTRLPARVGQFRRRNELTL